MPRGPKILIDEKIKQAEAALAKAKEIGIASCRERVEIAVGAGS